MAALLVGNYGQNTDVDSGAAEALSPTERLAKTGVRIKAAAANSTGIIYVGNNDSVSTSTGYPLGAGEECSFDVAWFQAAPGEAGDLRNIYVIGSANNLAVAFWYA